MLVPANVAKRPASKAKLELIGVVLMLQLDQSALLEKVAIRFWSSW